MGDVIVIVADRVLPITALSNAAFRFAEPHRRSLLIRQRSRECGVYPSPAFGKVAVSFGKRPQAVHVVGQHDPGASMRNGSA
jgi:hypothetical protein